ncbi:COP9 signalosome complex subunit 1-like [Corticium candelabrum]|uniref:COP9 signalosome complex subunit 1-like n=1 Tax=Corticium candelabrum TaxID=121492 RepID=UPI002E271950|nr:COP9 signalosome complex subunit 1-like [Corticium candelabrum]
MPLHPISGLREPDEPMQVDAVGGEAPSSPMQMQLMSFTVENPTLDLDAYASCYVGITKLKRLVFVAKHCPALAVDALRLAHTAVRSTFNTQAYIEITTKLGEAMSQRPDVSAAHVPAVDMHWVEITNKKAALKLEKLDNDLKNYKANSIKESIRRGHDDLGDHHLDCGDLSNALKCYSRARDYCTNARHVVHMCLNVIKVSVLLCNWSHVLNYVNKAEASPELVSESRDKPGNAAIASRLKCAAGLAELANKKYKNAARYFLQVSFDHCDFPDMLSPSNVAVYGSLCALATFDRHELQQKLVGSSSFKQFLELEPQLRDVIQKFYNSQYASCLNTLAELKDNLMLDMFLSQHLGKLYSLVRSKAMVQYFSPYLSADMRKMAVAFNSSVSDLEDELTQLILEGQISARIDSHSKTLYARDVDERSDTFERSLTVGRQYQMRTKALILRAALIRHQVIVKPPARDTGGEASLAPGSASSR